MALRVVIEGVAVTLEAVLILGTDLLWTVVCCFGVYYGWCEAVEATKALAWSGDDPRNRRLSVLHRRAARALLSAMVVGAVLGALVISLDAMDLYHLRALEIEPIRFVYRMILISLMALIVAALVILKQMRDIWASG